MKFTFHFKAIFAIGAAVAATCLTGCSSLSGYDGSSSFSCKAPPGVICQSMDGVYVNAQANNLPGQRVNMSNHAEVTLKDSTPAPAGAMTVPLSSGTPIRSAPQVLRAWFAPWPDSDDDYHDQEYVYMAVDNGDWLMAYTRHRLQNAFRPVLPPVKALKQGSGNSGADSNPPGATSSGRPSVTNGLESIGTVQHKPSAQDAYGMVKGLQLPNGTTAQSDANWQ